MRPIGAELEDRYGRLPEEARLLREVMIDKTLVRKIGARAYELGPARMVISISADPRLDPAKVMKLIQRKDSRCGWGTKYASVFAQGTARVVDDDHQRRHGIDVLMAHYERLWGAPEGVEPGVALPIDENLLGCTQVFCMDVEHLKNCPKIGQVISSRAKGSAAGGVKSANLLRGRGEGSGPPFKNLQDGSIYGHVLSAKRRA